MLCLGVESSCDDTALALVKDGCLVARKEAVQADIHALFGGVVPEIASREHERFIGPLLDSLLAESGCAATDVDVVAVARGPGLLGSLLVGIAFAKAFALGCGARFIGVNHLNAHIFVAGINAKLELPALALLVSGGHTHLCRVEGPDKVLILGRTLDDAAGEAFDKAGKLLGLPYPAGHIIDRLANEGVPDPGLFPRPYLDNDSLDFSFSGLKTAMAVYVRQHPNLVAAFDALSGEPLLPQGQGRGNLADTCASYRLAVVETLNAKVERALERKDCRDVRSILLAGGVAANSLLRETVQKTALRHGLAFTVPERSLCTDNGVMVAYLGWLLASRGFAHDFDLAAVPRGQKIPDDMTCWHGQGH